MITSEKVNENNNVYIRNKNKQKIALISGITGQDGSYLTELLISKNYIVHGILRRSSSFNTSRIEHIYEIEEHSDSILKFY